MKFEACIEIYEFIDLNIRKLPRNIDGSFDESSNEFVNNDVDALRHAYVSGVYTMEYGESVADILGRLNELMNVSYGKERLNEENMDLWNNAVGRKYGKISKTKNELFQKLSKALKKRELITNPKDPRRFKGPKSISKKSISSVIVIRESNSGENLEFFDLATKRQFNKEEFVKMINDGLYPGYSIKEIKGKKTPVSKRDRFNFNNLG